MEKSYVKMIGPNKLLKTKRIIFSVYTSYNYVKPYPVLHCMIYKHDLHAWMILKIKFYIIDHFHCTLNPTEGKETDTWCNTFEHFKWDCNFFLKNWKLIKTIWGLKLIVNMAFFFFHPFFWKCYKSTTEPSCIVQ